MTSKIVWPTKHCDTGRSEVWRHKQLKRSASMRRRLFERPQAQTLWICPRVHRHSGCVPQCMARKTVENPLEASNQRQFLHNLHHHGGRSVDAMRPAKWSNAGCKGRGLSALTPARPSARRPPMLTGGTPGCAAWAPTRATNGRRRQRKTTSSRRQHPPEPGSTGGASRHRRTPTTPSRQGTATALPEESPDTRLRAAGRASNAAREGASG